LQLAENFRRDEFANRIYLHMKDYLRSHEYIGYIDIAVTAIQEFMRIIKMIKLQKLFRIAKRRK